MIQKALLQKMYYVEKKSMQEIAHELGFSLHKVAYWMEKHKIKARQRGEAMYVKHNPQGDPFKFVPPRTLGEAKLFGLGLGLYWGEGNKANMYAIRLGNTDPNLIREFIKFLTRFFGIRKSDLQFGLQIFSDTPSYEALDFWVKELKISRQQVYKPTITKSGSVGTYRKKSKYGVVTVLYHNKKLRELFSTLLPL